MWRACLWSRTTTCLLIAGLLLSANGSQASDRSIKLNVAQDAIYNESTIQLRVLGGGDAEPDAWPSMAAIVVSGNFSLEDRFFCGGSVIADRWILTAAHCMFDPFGIELEPADIRAVVGIHDLQDESTTEFIVSNIFLHPEYNTAGGTLSNDIALVELANVVSVPNTTMFAGDTESISDSLGFIAGWGATSDNQTNGSDIYPNLLQDASVPIVPLARCNSSESYRGGVLDTQVCAGYREGGVDSCIGDSGGPLFVIENGEQVQVGITSFGNGCGLPDFYGVYTDIAAFRTWIGNYVELTDSVNTNGFMASVTNVSTVIPAVTGVVNMGTQVDESTGDITGVSSETSSGIGALISQSSSTTETDKTDTLEIGAEAVAGNSVVVGTNSGGGGSNVFFIGMLLVLAYLRRTREILNT